MGLLLASAVGETQASLYMVNHSVLKTLARVRADHPIEASPQASFLRVTNQQVDGSVTQYVRRSFKHKATLPCLTRQWAGTKMIVINIQQ